MVLPLHANCALQVPQLAGRPVSLLEFSPELPNTLLTVHGPSPDHLDIKYVYLLVQSGALISPNIFKRAHISTLYIYLDIN